MSEIKFQRYDADCWRIFVGENIVGGINRLMNDSWRPDAVHDRWKRFLAHATLRDAKKWVRQNIAQFPATPEAPK